MAFGADRNSRLALRLFAVVAVMVSLSFAAVPFYSWFCRTTGYGGTTSVATQAPKDVLDREIIVRFDANVAKDMPWKFRPKQMEMKVRVGETGLAFFEAYNPTDHVTAGQAAYNVTPDNAGKFFDKIACFCFNLQVLKPGERVDMPVSFFVDPEIVKDADASQLKAITLSYTMFPTEVPEEERAVGADQDSAGASPATRLAVGPGAASDQTLEQ
ncbi:cytochrome c oxidase assembly protein [Amaricoccus solimangrovi]|uniref:Cytochrome c oxidase assembly protein CtaG n=1 Tax=Amaricoccus solimangrovi TaxID=2589815 RepID=A0A501WJ54_9RHOB|nr:cytochrome c oxidase assembly protein [Amaricoccus solimangrovi]TPE48812.1 cytochrome c oxidase assembly protein [Amaricoccus solimangrovi]